MKSCASGSCGSASEFRARVKADLQLAMLASRPRAEAEQPGIFTEENGDVPGNKEEISDKPVYET